MVSDDKQKFRVKGGINDVFITGKCRYARTETPDSDYEKWSICIWPDEESMVKVHKLISEGIRNVLKKDDDGYHITFGRPIKIKLRSGKIQPMEPPTVIDKDGVLCTELIGDGSDVTIKLDVYGGKSPFGGSYKAARLAAVRVNNLVPYRRESMSEAAQYNLKGLEEQPEQLF